MSVEFKDYYQVLGVSREATAWKTEFAERTMAGITASRAIRAYPSTPQRIFWVEMLMGEFTQKLARNDRGTMQGFENRGLR